MPYKKEPSHSQPSLAFGSAIFVSSQKWVDKLKVMHRALHPLLHPTRSSPTWWQWPGVLSLEAPFIAALWQRLFGSALGVPVRWPESLLLALTVWLIYSADRLLDSLKRGVYTQRHRFYVAHRRSVLGLWLIVLASTLGLALTLLTPLELVGGMLLGAALLGYFASRHLGRPERHPKELQIALFFTLGVSLIPLLNGAPHLPLFLATGLLGILAFLNCAFIALWEGAHDLEPAPFTRRHPRLARRLRLLPLALAVGCALTAALFPKTLPLELALAGSSLLLYGLDILPFATKLGPEARHVAGDAALLTPLLVLLLSPF